MRNTSVEAKFSPNQLVKTEMTDLCSIADATLIIQLDVLCLNSCLKLSAS